MRRFLLAAALAALVQPALADPTAQPGIESTIRSQIDAFLVDDFARAFDFASPGIKNMFGSPDRFGEMVQSGYPMVWRPAEVRFLDLREIRGRLVQRVMITDQQGQLHLLDYLMIETEEGWQIAGVQLLQAPAAGT